MKFNQLLIQSFVISSLILPTVALADDVKLTDTDVVEGVSSEADCATEDEIDLIPPPKAKSLGDVSYVSGGICVGGVQQMKAVAKNYPLEVVFVEKTSEYEKENYIADVNVKINDTKDNLILETVTEGPFLLVNLPDGRYKITAEYNGVAKENRVKINSNKHARVVFLWPEESKGE